jgi:hypothetical protein
MRFHNYNNFVFQFQKGKCHYKIIDCLSSHWVGVVLFGYSRGVLHTGTVYSNVHLVSCLVVVIYMQHVIIQVHMFKMFVSEV